MLQPTTPGETTCRTNRAPRDGSKPARQIRTRRKNEGPARQIRALKKNQGICNVYISQCIFQHFSGIGDAILGRSDIKLGARGESIIKDNVA